jgi:hypothetical protein
VLQFPDARTLLTGGLCALVFLGAIEATGLFHLASHWSRLFAAGGLWLLLYLLPVVALDSRLRHMLGHWRQSMRGEPA